MKQIRQKKEQTPLPPLSWGLQRIAIIHDAFLYRGGGERLVTLMAKSLRADLISGFFSGGSFDPRELGFDGRMIALGTPVFREGFRHMILKWRCMRKSKMLSEYDIVIFSGNCLDALRHVRKDAKKIYYCHTPPRYLFDFQDQYLSKIPFFIRPIFRAIFARHAAIYRRQLQQFDTIFTNSQNVHDRLLRFCSQESEVLYPPTDVHRFAPKQVGKHFLHHDDIEIEDSGKKYFDSYYLSFCRLSPPKRVDLIIDAFIGMPHENLILTYGKNDPLKNKILKAIEGKSNIHAIESPTDTELIDLIRGATATVYIPIDEDFGMAPVESMACGTPVIGVNEGGLRETIIHNQTGKLIDIPDHDTGVARLQELILSSTKEDWKHMHGDCILRALDFSLEKFEKRLQSL